MPIEITQPAGRSLDRLARKLQDRQPRLQDLIDRFNGDGPLPHVSDAVREAYRNFQKKSRTNWAELIVEAPRERMTLTGFRTAADTGESGDARAMEIREANGLAVESADVYQMMLAAGDGYMIVGGPEGDTDIPIITGEDPRQVVTIHDPVRQRVVREALKIFHDPEQERDYAFLYVPGRRYVATRDVRKRPKDQMVRFSARTWDWDGEHGGAEGEALPHDIVPVVRFRNRRGVGEFELHRDLLDRIDHMVLQRLVIATFQAFKQRAIKNLPDSNPDTGEEIDWTDVFSADPGALWQVPEGVEFWESGQVDLTPCLNAVKDDLRSLAAVTRTALSYLAPDAAAQSAEGASLMREGLVYRTEDRIARASEAEKDVMSLAFRNVGDTQRADRSRLIPIWASAERMPMQVRGDAAAKAQDIPRRERLIRIWGFTPGEADQMMIDAEADAFGQLRVPSVNGQ